MENGEPLCTVSGNFTTMENGMEFPQRLKMGLAGVAQWIEHEPANQRVMVQIPVRAHAWVAGQVPSKGHVRSNHTLMFVSLSFSFPSPLSKNK